MKEEDQLLDKRKQFEAYLAKQDKERELAQAQKKEKDERTKDVSQKMLVIQKQFRTKLQDVEAFLEQYKKKEVKYEEVNKKYSQLKQYYLEINYALLTYDRQGYKEVIQRVLTQMQDLKKQLEPRRKFKFSRPDSDFGAEIIKQQKLIEYKQGYESQVPGIQNVNNQSIVISRQSLGGPYKVINAENCSIEINGLTDILFLKNLTNCKIKAGPTKSTVFIDKCTNCNIEINCHQLRIHNTNNTRFGVFTSSKGIIEDTTNVLFKKYNHTYEGIQNDIKQCNREGKDNLWRQIQDFNWLKQDASPNFALLDSFQYQN